MTVTYELVLTDQFGTFIDYLPRPTSLEWGLHLHHVGGFSMQFATSDFPYEKFRLDRKIEITRLVATRDEGRFREHILTGFLRDPERFLDGNKGIITLAGPDAMYLLEGRLVAYDPTTALADKTGACDDLMKEYVDENLGASAAADRDITAYGFSIENDASAGPTVAQEAGWKPLLQTLQELHASSMIKASESASNLPTYFTMAYPTPGTFQFRTHVNQPGRDRGLSSANPFIMSVERDMLRNPHVKESWRNEHTVVYAGGPGQGIDRVITTVQDDGRLAQSVFARREVFRNANMYTDNTARGVFAEAELHEGRPVVHFGAEIVEGPNNRFGLDWNFGYKVVAEYEGNAFDCIITELTGSVDGDGKETLGGRLEYVNV